jgi:hypothetical protein
MRRGEGDVGQPGEVRQPIGHLADVEVGSGLLPPACCETGALLVVLAGVVWDTCIRPCIYEPVHLRRRPDRQLDGQPRERRDPLSRWRDLGRHRRGVVRPALRSVGSERPASASPMVGTRDQPRATPADGNGVGSSGHSQQAVVVRSVTEASAGSQREVPQPEDRGTLATPDYGNSGGTGAAGGGAEKMTPVMAFQSEVSIHAYSPS